ncbi:MAG: YhbY family RNA-binding protein [Thomasclavelia sp.]
MFKRNRTQFKCNFPNWKEGVHQTQIEGIDAALEAHELIKIKILESCSETKNEVAIEISMKTKLMSSKF